MRPRKTHAQGTLFDKAETAPRSRQNGQSRWTVFAYGLPGASKLGRGDFSGRERAGRLSGPVQSKIEDVEVAQPAVLGDRAISRIQGTGQDERNRLLRDAAMRSQPVAGEPGEVVLIRPRADRGICVGYRDEIAFPLPRHFIARGCAFSIEDKRHAGKARGCVHQKSVSARNLLHRRARTTRGRHDASRTDP